MSHEEIRATNRVFEEEAIGRRDFGAFDRVYTRNARILPPGAPAVTGRPPSSSSGAAPWRRSAWKV